MIWIGKDLGDHLLPIPQPWAGTISTRSGCSKHRQTWPWTIPRRGHPQLLWTNSSSVSPPS